MTSTDEQMQTLLIADDHPIFRQGLKQIIERLPWLEVVAEAESGDAALAKLEYQAPDMLALDIAMPGVDGLEVLRRAGELDNVPAVIIITSYDDRAYLDRAMELGARAFVLKDSAGEDIVSCLEAVRRGEIYISPSLGSHIPNLPQVGSADLQKLDTLTPTERTVLSKVAEFKTSKEIALELGVSYRTVQNHRSNICDKLDLHGVHQLMAFAREHSERLRSQES